VDHSRQTESESGDDERAMGVCSDLKDFDTLLITLVGSLGLTEGARRCGDLPWEGNPRYA